MATSDKLETDTGIHGFRQRIQGINDTVARENQKTETLTKEIEIIHASYIESLKTKEKLRTKIEEVRNQILKVSKEDLETRINVQKDIYSQMQQMLKTAEDKKMKLENRIDEAENKTRDCATKMTSLNLELEYKNIDTGRKSKGFKDVSESVADKEKYCQELEQQVNAYDTRIEVAQNKIAEFESRIAQAEKDIENTVYRSTDMQSNIKELILAANTDLSYFT